MDEDREALRTIFNTCQGEKWYIKIGWKTYDDPARWYGITVDKHRIRGIDLPNNEIKGVWPMITYHVNPRTLFGFCSTRDNDNVMFVYDYDMFTFCLIFLYQIFQGTFLVNSAL